MLHGGDAVGVSGMRKAHAQDYTDRVIRWKNMCRKAHSPALRHFHRDANWECGQGNQIILFAARREPAPLEKPQDQSLGPGGFP
jgi:hypothetical protein